MILQENKPSYRAAVKLSLAALSACVFLRLVGRSILASLDAFLWIEGTVLLACSLQSPRMTLSRGLRAWFDTGFVGTPAFVPLFYNLGLFLLAAAALVGAFLSN